MIMAGRLAGIRAAKPVPAQMRIVAVKAPQTTRNTLTLCWWMKKWVVSKKNPIRTPKPGPKLKSPTK